MKSNLFKKNRLLLCMVLFAFLPLLGFGQTKTIAGIVNDETGNSLPGVTVLVKGTNIGTVTDIEGKFSLVKIPENSTLVFSFIGMKTQEVLVKNQSNIKIAMGVESVGIDEVVAVGYGTQRKSDITSSVATVKSDDFQAGAMKDAGQLIQGKVAGLSITSPSGDPTASVEIMLRGVTTLMASSSPLVLIDGIPGDLNTVAPQDIESIDILKDGSAAAIYGTRGTNGVILITSKKASKNAPLSVEYDSYVSTQQYSRKADFNTAGDWRKMIANGSPLNDYGASTNWLDQISRTPISYNHNLTLKGGTGKSSYLGSINYDSREGMILKSDFDKFTARLDFTHTTLNDMLTFNLGLIAGNSNTNPQDKTGPYRQALIRNPTAPVTNPDGTWNEDINISQYENPVALLKEASGESKDAYTRMYGSATLKPMAGLNLKLMVSRNIWNNTYGYAETKKNISTIRDGRNGYASRSAASSQDQLLEFTTDYRKKIGEHELNGLIGYSYQDSYYESQGMDNYDFPTDIFSYNNMGAGQALTDGKANMSSYKGMSRLIGGFARINYSFKSKYLLTASIRREGSTKFGANYKWGNFPAIQAGWKISQENFMKSTGDWLDDLKLRAGYGITGTEPGASYLSKTLLTYNNSYILSNGVWVKTISPTQNPNPNLKWEMKKEANLGLDFSLLKGKISGSVDVYDRRTEDMLWDYSVPTPPYLYSSMTANVGVMENKGIEVNLQFIPVKTKDFQWSTNVNYSTNQNKLVSLSNNLFALQNDYIDLGYTGDPIQQSTHRLYIGKEVGDFYGYKAVDITHIGDEYGTTTAADAGVWVIQKPDGTKIRIDKASAGSDKQIIGNGSPKHYLNWNNNLKYKNFDLAITMRGAFGFQILNFQRMFYENPGITYLNSLKTANDLVYGKSVLNYSQEYTSYYVENGDYWKIDNVTLGYNFSPQNKTYIKSLRVYGSCQNIWTITGYKGIDPEVSRTGLTPGSDYRDKFPTTRTFTLGLNLEF